MMLRILSGTVLFASIIQSGVVANAAPCAINWTNVQQQIDGFGFSSAWCGTLSAAKNNALYNTLGMSLLRIRIDENNDWTDVTSPAPQIAGTLWQVVLPLPAGTNSAFYRLIK